MVSQSFQLFKHKAESELAQTTPESLYWGRGLTKVKRPHMVAKGPIQV